MIDIEREIDIWRAYLRSHGDMAVDELDELESHLRDGMADLEKKGLSSEEAFIVAVGRTGKADAVAREFSKVHTKVLWKQLMVDPADPAERRRAKRETLLVIGLALISGALSRLPELFGIHLFDGDELFYFRNGALFIVPAIACYFLWKFKRSVAQAIGVFIALAVMVSLANIYPVYAGGNYDLLIGIHLPILLWFIIGLLFVESDWRDPERRMDFLRFTGESFIYLVLILCGGAVLVAMAQMLFSAISIDIGKVAERYIVVIGGVASPMVAVYLAYAKKSIIENMAPVLAKIFSPLFLILLCAFLLASAITGNRLVTDRETLIAFDLLLALILAIILYLISARDQRLAPTFLDYIHAALILATLAVDVMALLAILGRIQEWGFTPNKTAAFGENIALLVNLTGCLCFYIIFFIKKDGFRKLVVWQTIYLPVFFLWALVVCFGFPIIFG